MSVFEAQPDNPDAVRLAAMEAAVTAISQQLADQAAASAAALAALAGTLSAGDAALIEDVEQEIEARRADVQRAMDILVTIGGGGGDVTAPNLVAIAVQPTVADTMSYWTGNGAAALTPLSSFGRSMNGAANDAAGRAALALGTMATQAAASYAPLAGADFAGPISTPRSIVGDYGGAASNGAGGSLLLSPTQRMGATTDATGNAYGDLTISYGNNVKGWFSQVAKTRGSNPNDFSVALSQGDTVHNFILQGSNGAGATSHVGTEIWQVDGNTFTGTAAGGEMQGRWKLSTGTGISLGNADPALPFRYALMPAIVANHKQQVLFPGGADNRNTGAGGPFMTPGNDFGGIVVIGPGGAFAGQGALRFMLTNAQLLATPEIGVMEVDGAGDLWWTNGAGQRKKVAFQ